MTSPRIDTKGERGTCVSSQLEALRQETRTWPKQAVIRQNLQCFLPEFDQEQAEYWTAVSRLNAIFAAKNVPLKTIKSIRCYPYVDSNIDIIVEKKQWRLLSDAICERSWRKPRLDELLEQTFVEPYKLKYKATAGDLAAAHFYAGVRWRYAAPFRLSGIDPGLLWRRLPEDYRDTVRSPDDLNILVPTDEFDMVIQAAHVTIENYRLTIGEIIHIGSTLAKPGFDRARMDEIARCLGLTPCVSAINDMASRYFAERADGPFPHKPLDIPISVILTSHVSYGLKSGPLGLVRAFLSLAWYPLMRIGRKVLGR